MTNIVQKDLNILSEFSSLIDVLDFRAYNQSEKVAYTFLSNSGNQRECLTYRQLKTKAQIVGASLQNYGYGVDERVLLLYPQGIDYITAFFGCLYIGAVPVPVYPPRSNRSLSRIKLIANDVKANLVLTTNVVLKSIENNIKLVSDLKHLHWLAIDKSSLDACIIDNFLPVRSNKLALIQYTSGSTGNPKGVMITHQNIIHNSALIYQYFEHTIESKVVSWLPFYHDMGLIGGMLQSFYGGLSATLFSPTDFLRQPFLWLKAISEYRATTSGAPNFAYEMCIDKIKSEDKKKLDLSSWDLAFIGAETIKAETIERFAEAFKECGFKKSAFYPCYGMAEATLMVTGGKKNKPPTIVRNNSSPNKKIVGCGRAKKKQEVIIFDSKNNRRCLDNEIGEIWIKNNESIALGYWKKEQLSKETFKAKTIGDKSDYLKTGDLGFIEQEELFVISRIKELIVIRGQNYYPQDIEKSVQVSHPALKVNAGAAFSIEIEGIERLVIVQEVERKYVREIGATSFGRVELDNTCYRDESSLREEIEREVTAKISQEYGLNIYDIVLIKAGSLLKTSSGKIQRNSCKKNYLKKLKLKKENCKKELISNTSIEDNISAKAYKISSSKQFESNSNKVESIISWLRNYASKNINSQLIDERRCIPPYIVLDFGNKGLLGMQIPEEYGGLGLSYSQSMQVIEQLGAIDLTLCLFVGLNNILGVRPILEYGNTEIKEELLPLLATGRELAAFALTEKNAGSNPRAIVSQVVENSENNWNIQGEKVWSGSASWAGAINVFVQHLDADGSYRGLSAFVVRRDAPGLIQGKEALTMGMRGMVQNTVYFDNVPVSRLQLLAEPGKGMEVAQDAMMCGRLAIAFSCLGGMKRCAQLISRYASRRNVVTGRLLDNPVILTRLGGLTAQITAVECLVTQTTEFLDRGITVPVELYTACKTSAPEFYWQAADNLVQFLGGRGYIETNIAPQILRDARILRIFEGPTETLNMFLGSKIVNQNRDFAEFIKNSFNCIDVYQHLLEATEKIRGRLNECSAFDKYIDTQRWAYVLIGEIATYSILLAATRWTSQQNPSKETNRAIAWIELQLEQKISRAFTITPDEFVTKTASATEKLIDSYQQKIGDIEQNLLGEDKEIDRLLRIENNFVSTQRKKGSSEVKTNSNTSKQNLKNAVHNSQESEKTVPYKNRDKYLNNSQLIKNWLSEWLSSKLSIPLNNVDSAKAFADYGIDSVMAIELVQDLTEWLPHSSELVPTLAWDFPNIETLAEHLSDKGEKIFSKTCSNKQNQSTMSEAKAADEF